MDNIDIKHCIDKDSKELAKIYAGVLTIDDVTHMNSSLELFRQFLISSLLSNKIQNFPIGFIVNTGTHKSGGVHWQGIYFDNKHRVYFFDSYGREPMEHYMIFTELILTFSYMRQHFRSLSMERVLSTQCFTPTLFRVCKDTLLKRSVDNITYNYYNKQLQSPVTNVCGEYALLFLYVMCRQKYPEMYAYSFWNTGHRFAPITPTSNLNAIQSHQLLSNDLYVRNTVLKLFGFNDKNVFAH